MKDETNQQKLNRLMADAMRRREFAAKQPSTQEMERKTNNRRRAIEILNSLRRIT